MEEDECTHDQLECTHDQLDMALLTDQRGTQVLVDWCEDCGRLLGYARIGAAA